jgi:hypothetical protein
MLKSSRASESVTKPFSTTWGKAFLGVGSARLRFLTLGGSVEGAAAASAAALANPCKASMGALREDLGKVSSDSSSEDGAVLVTIP